MFRSSIQDLERARHDRFLREATRGRHLRLVEPPDADDCGGATGLAPVIPLPLPAHRGPAAA